MASNDNVSSNDADARFGPLVCGIFGIILATTAIALRVWSRKISKASFGWDDWLAVAAVVRCLRIQFLYLHLKLPCHQYRFRLRKKH